MYHEDYHITYNQSHNVQWLIAPSIIVIKTCTKVATVISYHFNCNVESKLLTINRNQSYNH